MRVLLDTNVIVAAMRSPAGASAEVLRRVYEGKLQLLMSTSLMLEYESVCMMRVHREAAGLSSREVRIFLDALAALAVPVLVHYHWRPQLSDSSDEQVLEAAVNGDARYLVTFNVRDFGLAPARFGINVLSPKQLLERLAT